MHAKIGQLGTRAEQVDDLRTSVAELNPAHITGAVSTYQAGGILL